MHASIRCANLISWKYAFERISTELKVSNKKKQALDNLFSTGKISQSTYNYVNKELTDIILEIETRQKALADKMISKISELEEQTKTLEMFLANLEIRYVAGEVDEEAYTKENSVLSLGIEATKKDLGEIKNAVTQLLPEEVRPLTLTPLKVAEVPKTEEFHEKTLEIPLEAPTEEAPVEVPIETTVEEQIETTLEAPTEEAPVEVPIETTVEEQIETTLEAPTEEAPVEVESVSEAVLEVPTESTTESLIEEPTEVPMEMPTEMPVEVTPEEVPIFEEKPSEFQVEEAPTEEKFPSFEEAFEAASEEVAEESTTEVTIEAATETVPEEAPDDEGVTEAVFGEVVMEEASVGEVEETTPEGTHIKKITEFEEAYIAED